MHKRKTDDLDGSDGLSVDRAPQRKILRQGLDGTLENGKKALFRALKISRGFERQKLGRRQKTAKEQNAPTETARLAGEVSALKTLDLLAISEIHLYKSLLKSKPIASSPTFPMDIPTKVARLSKPFDTATANVTARLLNSNPAKAVLADILKNVQQELGLSSEEVLRKRKRLRVADYEGKPNNEFKGRKAGAESAKEIIPRGKTTKGTDDRPQSRSHSPSNSSGIFDTDSESIDYDKYNSRLAGSDDESEAGTLGSGSASAIVKRGQGLSADDEEVLSQDSETIRPHYHPSRSLSPSLTPSLPSSPRVSAALRDARPSRAPRAAKATTKQTTFLPSLIGGYWSGSESAPEDDDLSAKPRKNRRGQQERRAIWEKKYGRSARHLQGRPQARPQNRDDGWDARRGASDGRGRRGRRRGGMKGGRDARNNGFKGDLASGANGEMVSDKRTAGRGQKVGARRKGDDGPLHPSWEAKKKAKEKAGSGLVPFQGKKVVFG